MKTLKFMIENNILNMESISPQALSEINSALVTRGKRKGLIKKSAPKHDAPGYIGWQALMSNMAPVRVSVFGLMMLNEKDKKVFDNIEAWCDIHHHIINATAQNPFEFNMFSHRYDVEKIINIYTEEK